MVAKIVILMDLYNLSIYRENKKKREEAMGYDVIDYGKLVDEAMHIIVYKVLKVVEEKGLPGNHHFFISFITKHPGVKLAQTLASKYPREMTIVLQYQFQDLKTDTKGFEVTLSFGGNREKIYIPFAAITTFADPSVQFGLQFREVEYNYSDEIDIEVKDSSSKKGIKTEDSSKKAVKSKKAKSEASNNVVSLDRFRKKKE